MNENQSEEVLIKALNKIFAGKFVCASKHLTSVYEIVSFQESVYAAQIRVNMLYREDLSGKNSSNAEGLTTFKEVEMMVKKMTGYGIRAWDTVRAGKGLNESSDERFTLLKFLRKKYVGKVCFFKEGHFEDSNVDLMTVVDFKFGHYLPFARTKPEPCIFVIFKTESSDLKEPPEGTIDLTQLFHALNATTGYVFLLSKEGKREQWDTFIDEPINESKKDHVTLLKALRKMYVGKVLYYYHSESESGHHFDWEELELMTVVDFKFGHYYSQNSKMTKTCIYMIYKTVISDLKEPPEGTTSLMPFLKSLESTTGYVFNGSEEGNQNKDDVFWDEPVNEVYANVLGKGNLHEAEGSVDAMIRGLRKVLVGKIVLNKSSKPKPIGSHRIPIVSYRIVGVDEYHTADERPDGRKYVIIDIVYNGRVDESSNDVVDFYETEEMIRKMTGYDVYLWHTVRENPPSDRLGESTISETEEKKPDYATLLKVLRKQYIGKEFKSGKGDNYYRIVDFKRGRYHSPYDKTVEPCVFAIMDIIDFGDLTTKVDENVMPAAFYRMLTKTTGIGVLGHIRYLDLIRQDGHGDGDEFMDDDGNIIAEGESQNMDLLLKTLKKLFLGKRYGAGDGTEGHVIWRILDIVITDEQYVSLYLKREGEVPKGKTLQPIKGVYEMIAKTTGMHVFLEDASNRLDESMEDKNEVLLKGLKKVYIGKKLNSISRGTICIVVDFYMGFNDMDEPRLCVELKDTVMPKQEGESSIKEFVDGLKKVTRIDVAYSFSHHRRLDESMEDKKHDALCRGLNKVYDGTIIYYSWLSSYYKVTGFTIQQDQFGPPIILVSHIPIGSPARVGGKKAVDHRDFEKQIRKISGMKCVLETPDYY